MSQSHEEKVPLLPSTTAPSTRRKWTVDDVLAYIGTGPFQYLMLMLLGINYLADAGEVLLLSFLSSDVKCEWQLTSLQEHILTMMVFLGMAAGAIISGGVSDTYGRKPAAVMIVVTTTVTGLLTAAAMNYTMLVIFRLLVGFGIGGIILLLSFFSEFLPVDQRGRLMMIYQIFWTIGAILAAAAAWLVMPQYHWRGLVLVSAIPIGSMCIALPFIPESPRYLVVNKQEEKAIEILKYIAKFNNKTLPTDLQLVCNQEEPVTEKSRLKQTIGQFQMLFKYPLNRITPNVTIVWMMAAASYYGCILLTTQLESKNDSEDDSSGCTADGHVSLDNSHYLHIVIDAAAEIPAIIFMILTIDIIGRKRLICIGWIGAAISVCVLVYGTDTLQTVVLFCLRLFLAMMFDVLVVFVPELYPSCCRSSAVGCGNFVSRFGGALSPFMAQGIFNAYGLAAVAYVHGGLFFLMAFITILIPIDTAGRPMIDTLDELIETMDKQNHRRSEATEP